MGGVLALGQAGNSSSVPTVEAHLAAPSGV
jgi:hypothetical protein